MPASPASRRTWTKTTSAICAAFTVAAAGVAVVGDAGSGHDARAHRHRRSAAGVRRREARHNRGQQLS